MVRIVRGFKFDKHEVDGTIGAEDKDNFHGSVVNGYEGREKIQVSCGEHKGEQDLAFSRKS